MLGQAKVNQLQERTAEQKTAVKQSSQPAQDANHAHRHTRQGAQSMLAVSACTAKRIITQLQVELELGLMLFQLPVVEAYIYLIACPVNLKGAQMPQHA